MTTTAALATAPATPPAARENLLGRLRHDELGALAPAVPIIAIMFLLLAGLVIDSSRLLTARARAVSYAEEAARAGASAIDPASEPLAIDENQARQKVRDYCAAVQARDAALKCGWTPTKDLGAVKVTASYALPTGLLGIVGVNTLHAEGTGEARPVIGVTEQDAR